VEIAAAFVTIRPETSGFEAELASALGGIGDQEVTVTADTGDAEAAVEGLAGEEVEVPVGADTADAEAEIDGIDAAPVEVPVTADTADAQANIDDLGGSISALSDTAGIGGGAVGGLADEIAGLAGLSSGATLGVGALVGSVAYVAGEAGEAQVSVAQLDQMVANMGANANVTSAGLQALATDLQQTAGFSDEAVMAGEAVVLTFQNVRNTADQPIFDRAIRSAADLARSPFGNGDIAGQARLLGRALEDPSASFGRLARSGVTFTQAQQDAITAMQESGDIAGAQAALLDGIDARYGGLAQTVGGTYVGAMDRAKESTGEAAEAIGSSLLPMLTSMAEQTAWTVNGLNDLNDATGGFLFSGPLNPPTAESLRAVGNVVGDLPPAWNAAEDAAAAYTQAQEAAADAVAGTLPTLDGAISAVDRAGQAWGVLEASTDPQAIIDNLSLALFAWDDFQANIDTVADWGPNIAAALQQLGPEVAGGLTNALAEGNIATIAQLDDLISQIQDRGGEASAVLTGFAQNGMDGAVAAVAGSAPAMGAAGTQAGATGAAGIDAGLAFSNAAGIGQIVGVQYGAGVTSGIASMAGTVSAVATNVIVGAGSTSAAYARGQSLGSTYGAGLVAGLASQIGNAGATAASLRRAANVESAGLTREVTGGGGKTTITLVNEMDGAVLSERIFEVDRRNAYAEGHEP